MLARHLLRQKKLYDLRPSCILRKKSQQATETAAVYHQQLRIPENEKKEPTRDPFVKSLFYRNVDTFMLNLREPQSHERFLEYFAWLKTIENYLSTCEKDAEKLDKQEILFQLKNLDVFKGPVHEDYQGLNLTETELTKLVETVSTIPWLGTYLVKNNIIPLRILSAHGSHDLKSEYCPKIMEGKLTPTMCLFEGETGINFKTIKTEALRHTDDSWTLNGEKTFVVNGLDSNLFLVFAKCDSLDLHSSEVDETLSMFLVERDFGGISCSSVYDTIGRPDAPMCTVSFHNTVVPKKNLIGKIGLGFEVMLKTLSPGNQYIPGQAISILRNFTNQLVSYTLDRKHYDKNFHEYDSTKEILGKIAYSLYSMESMAYLTNQIEDKFENQDVEIERAITDIYCANQCVSSIYAGLQLIGKESYLMKNPYIKTYADALALSMVDTNNVDATIYIASLGLQYAGKHLQKEVSVERNRAFYPIQAFKYMLKAQRKRKLYIKDNLHPSLQIGGDNLEECIHDFSNAVATAFKQHGLEIPERHGELFKLNEMITEIYALAACLARASRSYCIGLASGDEEKNMVVVESIIIKDKVKAIAAAVENGELANGEYVHKKEAEYMYQKHKYAMEHPLNKTF